MLIDFLAKMKPLVYQNIVNSNYDYNNLVLC